MKNTGETQVAMRTLPSLSPDKARDTRARTWAYVFECFNSHTKKKAAPASGPNDARKDRHAGTKYNCT